jgi:hypothetical protein
MNGNVLRLSLGIGRKCNKKQEKLCQTKITELFYTADAFHSELVFTQKLGTFYHTVSIAIIVNYRNRTVFY